MDTEFHFGRKTEMEHKMTIYLATLGLITVKYAYLVGRPVEPFLEHPVAVWTINSWIWGVHSLHNITV